MKSRIYNERKHLKYIHILFFVHHSKNVLIKYDIYSIVSTMQAQGVLKDMSIELLQHLDLGTAFIQVSTKLNPQGEIRGQVCV